MAATDTTPLLRWNLGSQVRCVSVSPDGTRVASGLYNHHIFIWDIRTGAQILGPLEGHSADVWSVAWSPDGTQIASGSYDLTIRVWDAHSGALVAGPFEGHTHGVNSVAFSPDGTRIVSGSYDQTIRVWDAYSGDHVAGPFEGHTDWISSVVFSPDGTRIVSGSWDNTIRVWDARSGDLVIGPFVEHTGLVYSVAFSPDGARIASGSDDMTICVRDARSGALIAGPFKGHTGSVNSVAFSPDSTRIVSSSVDNTIRVWLAGSGDLVAKPFRGHTEAVNSVTFSPDGTRIVSGSDDQTICIWNALHDATSFDTMTSKTYSAPSFDMVPSKLQDTPLNDVITTTTNMPSFDMVTSKMSVQELFDCLVKHGCADLTLSAKSKQGMSAVVASGGFGDVRRMVMDDGIVVAIKTLRLHVLLKDNDKAVKRAVREVYIWSKLCHVNVQELMGIMVLDGALGMVSLWREQGHLQQYIATNPDAKRYPLCAQLASGVSYLHSIDMVHGDLKAINVLVSEDGTLKISDFDYAILSNNTLHFSTTTRPGGGTLRWMAPELLEPEGKEGAGEAHVEATRNKQSDVYALGMTMLEIITGTVPYSEYRTDMGIYRAIHNKEFPRRPVELSGPDKRAGMIWTLLLECWNHDPIMRPDAATVVELLQFKRSAAKKRPSIKGAKQGGASAPDAPMSPTSRPRSFFKKLFQV